MRYVVSLLQLRAKREKDHWRRIEKEWESMGVCERARRECRRDECERGGQEKEKITWYSISYLMWSFPKIRSTYFSLPTNIQEVHRTPYIKARYIFVSIKMYSRITNSSINLSALRKSHFPSLVISTFRLCSQFRIQTKCQAAQHTLLFINTFYKCTVQLVYSSPSLLMRNDR